MQDERDYLMKYTFPVLRTLAAERDVTLTELDLRWGITEEEAKSGKVVEICLREIENSIPFFIGIIGNRYGWIPGKEHISENVIERFKDVNNYIERHLSVTEMEMQYGVLQRKEDMHAYFYIKEGEEKETSDNPKMLERLKKEVKASKYPSATYSSPENLGVQVEQAFRRLLDQLFPKVNLSELEKERIGQRAFMNQLCLNYIRDEKNFQVLDDWMQNWNQHQMVITGASGLGKSALIANWLKEKLSDDNRDYNIIYHFTGNGGIESSSEHIIKSISNEIKDIYGWKEDELGTETKLGDLFIKVSSEGDKPLLIVIDAINQIIDMENAKLLNWLPGSTKGIKILFSTLEDDRTMEVFKHRDYPIFSLRPLDIKRRSQMVRNYLNLYAKSLTDQQVRRIATDSQCENTLVLKTVLDELINFGIYEKLDERIEYYLAPESIEDFYQNLLQRYEDDYGSEFVQHALSLILVSKDGLQESTIQKLTEAPTLIWSQLYCSFINNFVVKNGKLNFSHSYIRNTVFNRYIKDNKEWENDCRYEILSYTIEHPGKDTFFEEPFQFSMIQDEVTLEALYKRYMSIPEVTATIYRFEKYNCINYWKILMSHGYDMHVLVENDFSKMDFYKNQRMIFELTSLAYIFGDNELAHKLAEKQLEIIINTPNVPNDLLIRSYNDAAQALTYSSNDDDFHKAINYYFKAIEIAGNTSSKEVAVTYNGLGQCCLFGNKNDLALACGEKALDLNRKFYGDIHHEIAVNLNVIAQAHTKEGNYTKAIEAFTKAINVLISIYGNCSTELIIMYYNLADCQFCMNDFPSALQSISKAIEIIEKTFGKKYYDIDSYIHLKNDILSRIEANTISE
jgi:preprotein translocase subunit SecA/nephrocystin-3